MRIHFMTRYVLTALLGLGSLFLYGQGTSLTVPKSITGSTHDINGQGCRSCHAPHNGSAANGGTQGTGLIQLWARSFPAASNTYGVYGLNSPTIKISPTNAELGGLALTDPGDPRMYSLLCLSCHDGVTSTFTKAMNPLNMVGASTKNGATFDSMGLTNDHPINIPYDPTKNTTLAPVASVQTKLPLYGANNTIQCSTCHDAHNENFPTPLNNYLRQNNDATHCNTCHP